MKLLRVKDKTIFILSVLTTTFILFIMAGLLMFKKQVFIERDTISLSEIFIGAGFLLICLFDITSIAWLIIKRPTFHESSISKILSIALGGFCLLLLIGDKTMVDEIGRESAIGRETLGEWIILYVFLLVQLSYNLLLIKLLVRSN
jgi:hypothetical protein